MDSGRDDRHEPLSGQSSAASGTHAEGPGRAPLHELPTASSDPSLHELLVRIEDYPPSIPDAVAQRIMSQAGCETTDPRVTRLITLAAQKYISDIILDCSQQAKMKGLGVTKKGSKEVRYTLDYDLLATVLQEYGIDAKRPPYLL